MRARPYEVTFRPRYAYWHDAKWVSRQELAVVSAVDQGRDRVHLGGKFGVDTYPLQDFAQQEQESVMRGSVVLITEGWLEPRHARFSQIRLAGEIVRRHDR